MSRGPVLAGQMYRLGKEEGFHSSHTDSILLSRVTHSDNIIINQRKSGKDKRRG